MNRPLRMAGLILVLGLVLGFGIWQQQGWAAGQAGGGLKQAGNKLKQLFSPAAASEAFSPAPRLARAAAMATISVTSLADGVASAANCPGTGTSCRLRDAIAKAVAGDTIDFSVTGTITLTSGQLSISKDLTITGPGATQLAVSGNNAIRIFAISSGFTTAISGLTIRNAHTGDGSQGSGIYNAGTLTLANNTVLDNSNGNGNGGGIWNGGSLTVINSTFSGNSANGNGGGIVNDGPLTVINSTISGNSNNSVGGGIHASQGTATIINSTISGNSADIGGGGIYISSNSTVNVRNTLIAGNTSSTGSPDVRTFNSMSFTSLGNNLIGNNFFEIITPTTGDLIGTATSPINPLLAPLANYGGPTQTHALLPGSPALNAGNNCVLTNSCASNNLGFNLTTDQRGAGFNRQVGSAVDIGAFESRGFTLAILSGDNQSTGVNTAFTNPLSVTVMASGAGEPTGGGQVTFTPPVSGASATLAGNPAAISSGAATTGTVTANATAGGPYNVVASAKGASAAVNFALTNTISNTAPTFTPAAAISRQQGSPAGAAVTVGTVADAQTAANSLTVTQIAGGTATGITVTGITNSGGTITAMVSAGCTATTGTMRFQVSDGSLTGTSDLQVNVTANTPPTLTYAAVSVSAGGSTSNSPTTATDNGSITGYAVQSAGTYTGTISVNSSGVVSVNNAVPVGMHTITIHATDNCAATTDATFTLTVGNNAPTITPAAALTRQQGSTGPVATIATVGDTETAASGLTVQATTVPAGITVTSITNSAGTITATVAAGCAATVGANTVVLTVTDGNGGTATANLTVNVTANTAPTLTYGNQSAATGGALNVNPTAATDNGGITGYSIVSVTPPMTAAPTVNSSGVVAITNAAPFGLHTITVRATDNCGVTTDASFTVNVICPTITLSPGSLSGGTIGAAYNQTLTAGGGASPHAFTITGGGLPGGLSLSAAGVISGTPTATGGFNFTATATDANNCTGSQGYSINVSCPAITLSPGILPGGTVGTAYNQTVSVTPSGTYSFAVTSGSLPPGLTLNASTGAITGAPTASGAFNFRITATGSGTLSSCSGFRDYSVTIACGTVALTPATLPNGTIGATYNQTVSATPADSYSFAVTLGSLPSGLTLNAATGAITGTPTSSGAFNFTITASSGGTGACSGSRQYAMEIACTVSLPALANATAGNAYSQSVAATPAGTYTYLLMQGNLPSGLTLNTQTGLLSGMPSVTGTYNFSINAQAGTGCSATRAYAFVINCPTVTITPASLPAGSTGASYSQNLSAAPAGGNYSYAMSGTLPSGLSLNPATGVLSGTPASSGNFNFTITATGFGSCTGSKAYSITIGGGCPAITLPDIASSSAVGSPYNQSVTASPSGSYSYTLTGNLPSGVTFYNTAALLYGYPSVSGTYNFTVTATDSNNCTGSKSYSLVIGGAGFARAVFGDFDGDGKTDFSVLRGMQSDWLIVRSSDSKLQTAQWGAEYDPYNDVIVPGDYDGDGKFDVAVYRRATGEWLIKCSKDGSVMTQAWGIASDTPVPGDYDGDGKTDIAVWRGAETRWYIQRSSDHQVQIVSWGTSNAPYRDVPVPADYDGDGKTDIAVFRQANGHWYIKQSSNGQVVDKYWGLGSDVPVPADYDGDGKADIAVWRGSETNWYVVQSSDGQTQTVSWGASWHGDVPVPGDYDGDGRADVAVWRATDATWYVKCSGDRSVLTRAHGQAGDTPVTARRQ